MDTEAPSAEPVERHPAIFYFGCLCALLSATIAAAIALGFIEERKEAARAVTAARIAELRLMLDEPLDSAELDAWRGSNLEELREVTARVAGALDSEPLLGDAQHKGALQLRTARAQRLLGDAAGALRRIELAREEFERPSETDPFDFDDSELPEPDLLGASDSLEEERVHCLVAVGRLGEALLEATRMLSECESWSDEWETDLDVLHAQCVTSEVLIAAGCCAEALAPLEATLADMPAEEDDDWRDAALEYAHAVAARAAAGLGRHDTEVLHLRAALSVSRRQGFTLDAPPAGLHALALARALAVGTPPETDEAAWPLEITLAGRRTDTCGDHVEIAEHIHLLALVLEKIGDTHTAETRWSEAAAMFRRLHDPRASEAEARRAALVHVENPLRAETRRRASDVEQLDSAGDADSRRKVVALNDLGRALRAEGKLREAHRHYVDALALMQRSTPGDDWGLATLMNNVGLSHKELGDIDSGLPLLERALAMRRRLAGGDHEDVAQSLSNVAGCLHARDELERALEIENEVVEMRRRLKPGDDMDLAFAIENRACTLGDLGRRGDAIVGHREALAMQRRLVEGDHVDVATTLDELGRMLYRTRDYDEAGRALEEALRMRRRLFDGDHPLLVDSLRHCAYVREATRDLDSALSAYRDALAMQRRLDPADTCLYARIDLELLDTLRARADESGALSTCIEAVTLCTYDASVCLDTLCDALEALSEAGRRTRQFAAVEDVLTRGAEAVFALEPGVTEARRRAADAVSSFYGSWHAADPHALRAESERTWAARR